MPRPRASFIPSAPGADETRTDYRLSLSLNASERAAIDRIANGLRKRGVAYPARASAVRFAIEVAAEIIAKDPA
jgi:hypothetical protein